MNLAQLRHQCLVVLTQILADKEQIEGRVRLQKTFYLLRRAGLPSLQDMEFFYDDYGPHSPVLSETLKESLYAGILLEHIDTFSEEWQKYKYSLSNSGRQYAAKHQSSPPASLNSVLRRIDQEHWKTLELASTTDYLMHEEGMDLQSSLNRAISLKPTYQPFTNEAKKLLSDLDLFSA